MQLKPPTPPRPALPDPFAFRGEATYRRNAIKRTQVHNQDWNFDMNPNAAAAPPATAQEQARLDARFRVECILKTAEKAELHPQRMAVHADQIMAAIEAEAGPFSAVTDNLKIWMQMVLLALDNAERAIHTDQLGTMPLPQLTGVVRAAYHAFEMENLGIADHGQYAEYIQQRTRDLAAMRSHPGHRPGGTKPITVKGHVLMEDPSLLRHPTLHIQPLNPVPQPQPQPETTEMQNQNASSIPSSGATIHITPGDGAAPTSIHIDPAQAGGPGFGERMAGMAATARKQVNVRLDDIKTTGRFKKAVKYTVGAVVIGGVAYAGYRAYRAGLFGAAARVVTEGIPNAADAIVDSAQPVPAALTTTVAAFFSK